MVRRARTAIEARIWPIMNEPTTETELREGCCGTWPKPCSYHEGYLDGFDVGWRGGKAEGEGFKRWRDSVPASGTTKDSADYPDGVVPQQAAAAIIQLQADYDGIEVE